jgi:Protein of unknown function (DUF2946)
MVAATGVPSAMALRQRRDQQPTAPRGFYLAFIALAVQVMLPFVVAIQIARLGDPAFADTVICSALGPSAQHDGGNTSDHHGPGDACPLCGALALGQAFVAAATPSIPVPLRSSRITLAAIEIPSLALPSAAPYQSRAPPVIA